jgi:hypothetical protein
LRKKPDLKGTRASLNNKVSERNKNVNKLLKNRLFTFKEA